MTPEQQYLTTMAQHQAAHDDHPAPPVCPSSPEGAMPLQSATLPDKNSAIPHQGAIGAWHYPDTWTCVHCGAQARFGEECICRNEIPHKNFPIPKSGLVAATHEAGSQRVIRSAPTCRFCGAEMEQTRECLCRSAIGAGQYEPGQQTARAYEGAASGGSAGSANLGLADIEGNAQKLPDWKDLDLRPGKVWQMKPEPKLESYEGIPAEVINEAHILGSDAPHRIIEKLEEQMKGKWAMVRFGQPAAMKMVSEPEKVSAEEEAHRWAASLRCLRLQVNPDDFGYILTWEALPGIARYATVRSEVCERALTRTALTSDQADKQVFDVQDETLARAVAIEFYLEFGSAIARSVERACDASVPEEMVNVRGEQRPVDEYCVATPVPISGSSRHLLSIIDHWEKTAQEETGMNAASVPCEVPNREEALAMREMVEKAAVKLRGELHFDEGVKVVEETYDVSFLNAPRQHDSPLSARVVPASEAPDPKVGW